MLELTEYYFRETVSYLKGASEADVLALMYQVDKGTRLSSGPLISNDGKCVIPGGSAILLSAW